MNKWLPLERRNDRWIVFCLSAMFVTVMLLNAMIFFTGERTWGWVYVGGVSLGILIGTVAVTVSWWMGSQRR
jgi:hypothetical protein